MTNMITVTISGQTTNEVIQRMQAMLGSLQNEVSSKLGAPETKAAKLAKPAKAAKPAKQEIDDEEDFTDEDDFSDDAEEIEEEEDTEEMDEDEEPSIKFEDVKKTLTKLGVKNADAPRDLLAKYKLKGLKDLQAKPKLFNEINQKASALLKKSGK